MQGAMAKTNGSATLVEPQEADYIKGRRTIGYTLGRLFCTLEQLQRQARDQQIDTTFKTLMSQFPSCPRHRLIMMLSLSVAHEQKVTSSHRHEAYVRRKMELLNEVGDVNAIPERLDQNNTLDFHLGYAAQMAFDRAYGSYKKALSTAAGQPSDDGNASADESQALESITVA